MPSATTKCHILSIPPELRNEIHSLVYRLASSTNFTASVDLLTAQPPSKSLLLACRQVYDEVKGLYRTAYQAFWTEMQFTLDLTLAQAVDFSQRTIVLNQIRALLVNGIERIRRLRLTDTGCNPPQRWNLEHGYRWTSSSLMSYFSAVILIPTVDIHETEDAGASSPFPITGADVAQAAFVVAPEIEHDIRHVKNMLRVKVSKKDEILAFVSWRMEF